MSSDRGMTTIGRESSIVFSGNNGDVLMPYPRYRQSSNGFARGPHNEQLARGEDGLIQAKAAVLREIQAMLDRQARLGRSPLGCTSCFHRYEDMPKVRAKPDNRNGQFSVNLRGYWNLDYDQCFDQITFGFRMRAGHICWREVQASALRVLPFEDFVDSPENRRTYRYEPHHDIEPENGEVQRYTQSGSPRKIRREFRLSQDTTTRQSVDMCWTNFRDVLESVQNQYISWECDTDLDALEELVQGYLDATSIGRTLNPVARPFAEAMQAAGFNVTWQFQEETENFTLLINLNEHSIRITNTGDPGITCNFAADEERLNALRTLRLEQELIDSKQFLELHRDQTEQR